MKLIQTIVVLVIAILYCWMGYKALASPTAITGIFDVPDVTGAMKNEIGAVYGGFGFAFGISLIVAFFRRSSVATGVILCLGILTLGMAAGRAISFCLLQPDNRYPMLFMGMEILMGGLLTGISFSRMREQASLPDE